MAIDRKQAFDKVAVMVAGRGRHLGSFPDVPSGLVGDLPLGYDGGRLSLINFEAERVKLEADERLTPIGRKEALREFALRETLPHLRRMRGTLAGPEARLAEWKARLRPFPPRQRDDLTGELRDQELRRFVRELPSPEERRKAISKGAPELRRAVLSAPAELSGLTPHLFESFYNEAVAEQHGEALEEVRALEEAVTATRSALDRAHAVVREVAELPREVEGS